MPLPIWLIPVALKGSATVAGAAGVGAAAHGVKKMKDANDTMEATKTRYEANMAGFEHANKITTECMDELGKLELKILHSFSEFSDVFEQMKNRPIFDTYSKNGVPLSEYDGEEIKEVSIGAGLLLGGLGGVGLGAAGGFAAAGATQAAVMAMGTASTGTAIASLSGASAINATLALLGGGTIAAGGGGMAAGTAALGAATLGVGLLVGGFIFNFTGNKLSDKADEAWKQMNRIERKIKIICNYLADLCVTANSYYETLSKVNSIYQEHLNDLKRIVTTLGHTDWNTFAPEEKKLTENTVLLVGLLYNMCKVEFVLKAENEYDINTINKTAIMEAINNAEDVLAEEF